GCSPRALPSREPTVISESPLLDFSLDDPVAFEPDPNVFVIVPPFEPLDGGAARTARGKSRHANCPGHAGTFRHVEAALAVPGTEDGFDIGQGHAGFDLIIVGFGDFRVTGAAGDSQAKEKQPGHSCVRCPPSHK